LVAVGRSGAVVGVLLAGSVVDQGVRTVVAGGSVAVAAGVNPGAVGWPVAVCAGGSVDVSVMASVGTMTTGNGVGSGLNDDRSADTAVPTVRAPTTRATMINNSNHQGSFPGRGCFLFPLSNVVRIF
jgi:hypothetical protein